MLWWQQTLHYGSLMIWVNNYKIKLKFFQTLESICSYWSWDYTHSCMSFNYKLFIRVTDHPSFFVLRPSLFILYFLSTDKGASQECMVHDGKRYEIYLHAIENMKIVASTIIYLLTDSTCHVSRYWISSFVLIIYDLPRFLNPIPFLLIVYFLILHFISYS